MNPYKKNIYLNNKMDGVKLETQKIKLEKRSFIHNYTSQNEIQLDKTEINNSMEINENNENKEISNSNESNIKK
tara:strand:+ start:590 stop:811 length:222 start_codon:yes stop_codon:yes gene_type:complete